jgi:uncharacterized protein (TIGR00251 family)
MVKLEQAEEGVVMLVRAHAGARRSGIVGVHDGALKVAVTQAAEKGKANKAIVETLCKELALRRSQVHLVGGATSPQKRFLVCEITLAELYGRIATVLKKDG